MATRKSTLTSRNYSTSTFILPTPVRTAPTTTKQVDAEYENWKAQNGYAKPLSNEEYYRIYGIWR